MKLTPDHTQRLNLHAVRGAQRADVGSIRAIWTMKDRIALDADEERAVEVRREMVGGREGVRCGILRSCSRRRKFEFTDPEVGRIKAALQMWDAYGAAADRRWLDPILVLLFDQS